MKLEKIDYVNMAKIWMFKNNKKFTDGQIRSTLRISKSELANAKSGNERSLEVVGRALSAERLYC